MVTRLHSHTPFSQYLFFGAQYYGAPNIGILIRELVVLLVYVERDYHAQSVEDEYMAGSYVPKQQFQESDAQPVLKFPRAS